MHPFGAAVDPVFFFPDWDDFLQPVNQESSRIERLVSMGTTHGHGDADIAKLKMSQPMHDYRFDDGPACAGFRFEFFQLRLGHFRIAIVIQRDGLATVSHLANCTEKQYDGTGLCRSDGLSQRGKVDGFVGELNHR